MKSKISVIVGSVLALAITATAPVYAKAATVPGSRTTRLWTNRCSCRRRRRSRSILPLNPMRLGPTGWRAEAGELPNQTHCSGAS